MNQNLTDCLRGEEVPILKLHAHAVRERERESGEEKKRKRAELEKDKEKKSLLKRRVKKWKRRATALLVL